MNQQIPAVEVTDVPADAVLLDVREDDEFAAGHAPDAVHVPMSALPARVDDIPDAELLYVICRSGGRSAQVTGFLQGRGVEAVNVAGGMQSWAANGKAMASESGAGPMVI